MPICDVFLKLAVAVSLSARDRLALLSFVSISTVAGSGGTGSAAVEVIAPLSLRVPKSFKGTNF
jgi:hypothetical protein